MGRYLFYIVIMAATVWASCAKDETAYKFFVAGHTYGDPNVKHLGMHPPFVDHISKLNADNEIELGFLTGDILKNYETTAFPDSAKATIAQIDVPVHIAAGNHDIHELYPQYFGDYYYSFSHRDDLHIILTPGLDKWNISGDQLAFLEQTLADEAPAARHIFIYVHELIWWTPDNEYKDTKINYKPYYPGKNNFDEVVKPLLLSYPNHITIFAGDLGATDAVSSLMYDEVDNLTLIGTGMGSGTKDNIIIVTAGREVHYEVVPLKGSKMKGGSLNKKMNN